MDNKNATKRKLTSSVLAMIVCIAMLIGTTFAWFTDTASTGVNTIQSGKLDVALEMKTDDGWVSAEGKTLSWVKDADHENEAVLWEPGCTYQLPELRVVNKGDLALKYKLIITGITGDAKLLDAIDFTYGTGIALDTEVSLAPGGKTEGIVIKGHMKESAGNEYQELSIDNIGITVVATQDTVEYDSTTNQYDKDALYPAAVSSATDIRAALAGNASVDSSNIVLTNDVKVEDGIQLGVTNDTAINFNGNTLTGAVESGSISSSDGPTNLVLSDPNNSGEYSIDSNIVAAGGGYRQIAAVTVWKPTVTIQSGKYTHDRAVILCQLQTQDPDAVGVVVNGGTFDGKGAASVIANVFGNVIVNNGEFNAHYDGDSSGECVYVSSGSSLVPSITTINGGIFNADKRIFYVRVNTSYTQKIVINGGTFNVAEGGSLIQVSSGNAAKYLTIKGGTFNVDPTAYVDTVNYNVTHSGSTWTVTAK